MTSGTFRWACARMPWRVLEVVYKAALSHEGHLRDQISTFWRPFRIFSFWNFPWTILINKNGKMAHFHRMCFRLRIGLCDWACSIDEWDASLRIPEEARGCSSICLSKLLHAAPRQEATLRVRTWGEDKTLVRFSRGGRNNYYDMILLIIFFKKILLSS